MHHHQKKSLLLLLLCALMLPGLAAAAQPDRLVIEPDQFDDTCAPCRDFYRWANGGWLDQTKIPAEYPVWSEWYAIHERNYEVLHDILESAAKRNAPKGTPAQKIGDFYSTGMDTVTIEKQGLQPLQPLLHEIAGLKDVKDLQRFIDQSQRTGLSFGFDGMVDQDMKNNTNVIYYALQGGLGLPDRDYYTRDDSESVELRGKYVDHIARMFQLIGNDQTSARKKAETVLSMETRLANASLTNVEQRDPNSYYNLVSVGDAEGMTPNFSWKEFFAAQGLPDMEKFSYAHPKYFEEFGKMMSELPVEDWQAYLSWHAVNSAANYLNDAIVREHFDFYGRTLSGSQEMQPRWKRVLTAANGTLGEVLGQLYVRERFTPETKAKAEEMIGNIKVALSRRIKNLDWMSDETKQKALTKLAAFTDKIGYPDKWRDYSALEIKRDSYLGNMMRGWAFETQRNLNKIGQPVDKTEWGMNPQTVNAYYNPLMNEIVFPAAIMQPPFFSPDNDDATNYGSMGAVIGHEITHGFDDEGSQYDADGNLKNWWTEEDRKAFEERAHKIVDQYDNFVAVDDLKVNGALTLGENIADFGGCLIAYEALEMALGDKPREKIDGYTPEQRFFLAWAETWKTVYRPEYLRLLVQSDVHSPGEWRCNGPLQDLPPFWKAFDCHKGDPMVRSGDKQIKVW